MSKLQLKFDGWHCLSKRQKNIILKKARNTFTNCNFSDESGLLIENYNENEILSFCVEVVNDYKGAFGSWNGYEIKKISQRILYNYADRKRKLKYSYFKKLIIENEIQDSKLVLAGILYLYPDDINTILKKFQEDFNKKFKEMNENELKNVYRLLLMFASSKERIFSINK